MFQMRQHNAEDSAKHYSLDLMDFSTSGSHLPLPHRDWNERWCTLGVEFEKNFEEISAFEVRDDDVFVVTFPKAGTTWVQEAAWLLLNDLNIEAADAEILKKRSVFLDLKPVAGDTSIDSAKMAASLKSPRLLKSHLPANLIPRQIWEKKVKVIYCTRNPKDVIVSFFHFYRGIRIWIGTMEELVDDFINDYVPWGPFWHHVLEFWQMRNEPNVLFLTYEEMKRDLPKVLNKMCEFLDRPQLSAAEMECITKRLSFEGMKASATSNPTPNFKERFKGPECDKNFEFMRRGIIGSYKDELTVEDQRKIDQWIENNLKELNLSVKDIFGDF